MNTILLRKATINDIEQLKQISQQTFLETFSSTNTQEDMQEYLKESFTNEKLINELSNIHSVFYFALYENQVIGYLKINVDDAQTELQDPSTLEIERIYVLKGFHGNKVGQLLYNKALEIAKLQNKTYIWLGVWEQNYRAIAFYEKQGFIPFDKHIFTLGSDQQTDIMMKLKVI